MVELFVVLAIVGIVSGIALNSYSETSRKIILKDMHEVAKLFLIKAESCIRLTGSYGPCAVDDGDKDEAKLKKVLGITCPKGAICESVGRDHDDVTKDDSNKFNNYCLSIRREIRGKKYQVVATFNSKLKPVKKMRKNPKIFCKGDEKDKPLVDYIDFNLNRKHHHCKSYFYVRYAEDGTYTKKTTPDFKVCDWAGE